MSKNSKKEKDNDPTTWGPEKKTDFAFLAWEMHRQERALERDMFCFTRCAQSQQTPSQSHTPVGWELEEIQRLLNIILATSPVPDPKMPYSLQYAGFDLNDPFEHEPPRKVEDEPLFPTEEIPKVKNWYQVVYGYVKLVDENRVVRWYKDEDNALEKFLCYMAEVYLPNDMMRHRWAIDFTYDWTKRSTFWGVMKDLFSFKRDENDFKF